MRETPLSFCSGPALVELRFMFLLESEWNNKIIPTSVFGLRLTGQGGNILKLHLQDNE